MAFSITGIPSIDLSDIIYPIDAADIPLQSKFTIENEDGEKIILKFTEIESHSVG